VAPETRSQAPLEADLKRGLARHWTPLARRPHGDQTDPQQGAPRTTAVRGMAAARIPAHNVR